MIRTRDVDGKILRHEPQEAVSFLVKYLGYPLRADLGIQAVESALCRIWRSRQIDADVFQEGAWCQGHLLPTRD